MAGAPIDPAQLRYRVELQRQGEVDGPGGRRASGVWDTVDTVWAGVSQLAGSERFSKTSGNRATVNHRVTMRWRSDLRPSWRLAWLQPDGAPARVLVITACTDYAGDRRWLTVDAQETQGV